MQLLFALACVLLFMATLGSNARAASLDLDSSQQRLLKDAEYYLKEVDREVPKLTEQAEALRTGQATVAEQELHKLINQVNYAGGKLDNVFSRLQQLPAKESAVAKVQQRAADRASELLAAEQVFLAAKQTREAAVSAVDPQVLRAETDRFQGVSSKLGVPSMLQSHPAEALATVQEIPHMVELRNELAQKYSAVLDDHVGQALSAAITGFDGRVQRYAEEAGRVAPTLPVNVRAELAQADDIANIAVERRNAQQFSSGVLEQVFERARVKIELFAAIGGAAAESQALRKELKATEERLAAARKELESEILSSNTPPNDLYTESDKQELLAELTKRWTERNPNKDVLALRIPMKAWERLTGWRWALDRYEVHDFSELQVAIVVKHDAETAHVYYAFLERDHMKGDALRLRIDDKGEVPLYRQLLMSNWK